jgi:hypothetical protein
MLVFLSELLEYLCVIPFHELSFLLGLGRTQVILRHAYLAESRVNHGFWLTFCRPVSLEDPSTRMLMMVQQYMSTCYVLCLDCDSACL